MPLDDNGKYRRHSARGGGGGGGWRKRMSTWALRISVSVFIWTAVLQLASMSAVWQRPRTWPSPCFGRNAAAAIAAVNSTNNVLSEVNPTLPSPRVKLPQRVYRSNGFLLLSCNGGLNQMRAAICDMVTIARYLNMTLVIPELDKRSFWADTRDEVKIIKRLPPKVISDINKKIVKVHTMPPVSWSNMTYYYKQILPLIRKHKVIHFVKTDTRLANNGLPLALQKLRCRVNYDALKFTPRIEALGEKLISILQRREYFVVLHLRYEMDMLAFSGCSHGCSDEEAEELTRKRYLVEWWKEKEIDPEQKRLEGRCPLTPEETALVLKALDFHRDTTIYIAAGTIYGGERRMAALKDVYPNTVKKEMLLTSGDLGPLRNHSNQMAALDYLVALSSDVFIPSYDGNMAKVVEGHRRYDGFRKSIILDRKVLVEHLDLYRNGEISWEQFSNAVQEAHNDHFGQPTARKVIPDWPKLEDYFYANPQECLA